MIWEQHVRQTVGYSCTSENIFKRLPEKYEQVDSGRLAPAGFVVSHLTAAPVKLPTAALGSGRLALHCHPRIYDRYIGVNRSEDIRAFSDI